ncbi:MAG: hypothetical protein R3B53_02535 [Candidatus Paceibacterota bacterium]
MPRYLKLLSLWLGVPIIILHLAVAFFNLGVEWVAVLFIMSIFGGLFLRIAVVIAQISRPPKKMFKGPATFLIVVYFIAACLTGQVLINLGLILGTIICLGMLEWSQKHCSPPIAVT